MWLYWHWRWVVVFQVHEEDHADSCIGVNTKTQGCLFRAEINGVNEFLKRKKGAEVFLFKRPKRFSSSAPKETQTQKYG